MLARREAEREARARPLTRLGAALGSDPAFTAIEARVAERAAANEAARAAGDRHCVWNPGVGVVWEGRRTPEQIEAEARWQAERLARRLAESGVPPLYRAAGFDELTLIEPGGSYAFGNARAVALCRSLADKWHPGWSGRKGHNGVVLASPGFGCGKTHLTCAVLVALNAKGYRVRFTSAEALLNRYRASFDRDPGDLSASQIFDDLAGCDVLALDELGGEYIRQAESGERGGWARTKFLDLIEARYQAGRPILATTNLSSEELGRHYEGRMASRLLSRSVYVPMDGPDFRRPDDGDPFAGDEDLEALL